MNFNPGPNRPSSSHNSNTGVRGGGPAYRPRPPMCQQPQQHHQLQLQPSQQRQSSVASQLQLQKQHVEKGYGGGHEAVVLQRLQGALSAIRRERDQEFRSRNMVKEKLRSAKDAIAKGRQAAHEEQTKLDKSTEESSDIQQKIQKLEGTINDLKRKYGFKHDDLIRKRDKIEEQTKSMDKEQKEQASTVTKTQDLEHKERSFYKTIQNRTEKDTLIRVFSYAKTSNDGTSYSTVPNSSEQERENTLLQIALEALEKHASLLILPKMIAQKAETLNVETKIIQAHIVRLENHLKKHQRDFVAKLCSETSHVHEKEVEKNSDALGGTITDRTVNRDLLDQLSTSIRKDLKRSDLPCEESAVASRDTERCFNHNFGRNQCGVAGA